MIYLEMIYIFLISKVLVNQEFFHKKIERSNLYIRYKDL
jgi:hypothetical protein